MHWFDPAKSSSTRHCSIMRRTIQTISVLDDLGPNLAFAFLQFDSVAEAKWTLSLGHAFGEACLGGVELEVSPVEGGGVGQADLVRGGGGEDDRDSGRGLCNTVRCSHGEVSETSVDW